MHEVGISGGMRPEFWNDQSRKQAQMTRTVQQGSELGVEAWNEDQRLSGGQVSIPMVC